MTRQQLYKLVRKHFPDQKSPKDFILRHIAVCDAATYIDEGLEEDLVDLLLGGSKPYGTANIDDWLENMEDDFTEEQLVDLLTTWTLAQ